MSAAASTSPAYRPGFEPKLPENSTSINREKGLGAISSLPDYVFTHWIFPYLSPSDLSQNISRVSRIMLVFSEDEDLWKAFCFDSRKHFYSKFFGAVSFCQYSKMWKWTYWRMRWHCDDILKRHNLTQADDEETLQKLQKELDEELSQPLELIKNKKYQEIAQRFSSSQIKYMKWSRANYDMRNLIINFSHVERRSKLSVEEFLQNYDYVQRPVIITDIMTEWKAMHKWSLQKLAEDYGNVAFKTDQSFLKLSPSFAETSFAKEIDKETMKQIRKDITVKMRMRDYVHYMLNNNDEDPIYLFDGHFGERAPSLVNDYAVPPYFTEDLFSDCLKMEERPHFRWLVVGPARSGSSWHMDPYQTSAWNALITGMKRWAFYPMHGLPEDLKEYIPKDQDQKCDEQEGVSASEDTLTGDKFNSVPSYLDGVPDPIDWFSEDYFEVCEKGQRPWECMQYPGECIFVPAGWWHTVLNIDHSVAVTQNYVNTGNFHLVWPRIELEDTLMAKVMRERLLEHNRKDLFDRLAFFKQNK